MFKSPSSDVLALAEVFVHTHDCNLETAILLVINKCNKTNVYGDIKYILGSFHFAMNDCFTELKIRTETSDISCTLMARAVPTASKHNVEPWVSCVYLTYVNDVNFVTRRPPSSNLGGFTSLRRPRLVTLSMDWRIVAVFRRPFSRRASGFLSSTL